MERKLIVTLLQKNIQELEMITKGFMEMTEYPSVIVELARRKTEDILDYIRLLEEIKREKTTDEIIVSVPIPMEETVEIAEKKTDDFVQKEAERLEAEKAKLEAEKLAQEAEMTRKLAEETEKAKKVAEEKAKLEAESARKEAEKLAQEAEMAQKLAEEKAKLEAESAKKEAEKLAQEAEMAQKLADEKAKLEAESAEKAAQKIAEDEALKRKREELKEELIEKSKQEQIHKQPSKTVLGEQIAMQKNENGTTVAGAHTQKKIDDITQAISIGDRFRFQRELFSSNGELMNKTLSKLNQMIDFDEARAYLQKNFKWEDGNETVESFYSVVKRKFL